MTKDEMVGLLKTDVEAWNKWVDDNLDHPLDFSKVDLSGCNLTDAWLGKAVFRSADLSGAILDGANLNLADFRWAKLDNAHIESAELLNANLRRASLYGTFFILCELIRAKFTGARLTSAVIAHCELDGADFAGAILDETVFNNVELYLAEGLENIVHSGPSLISIEVLYNARGRFPKSFLQGVGVPEGLIDYLPSLIDAQEGIQFYSCFISYSHRDEAFTKHLHSRMRSAKLRVWYAPEDVQGGKKLHEQIETAIRVYDKLLVVLSKASLQSEWVKTEIRNARRAEKKTGKRKLFPVRLVDMQTIQEWSCFDADSGKDLGIELREYYIPDFSHWKDHDKFEDEFKKLLRDLKADAATPA